MKAERTHINAIKVESARISDLIASTRQIVIAAMELLSRSVPDTFLGRKTHEPFPKRDEIKAEHVGRTDAS
jgi:hypothetical protein